MRWQLCNPAAMHDS